MTIAASISTDRFFITMIAQPRILSLVWQQHQQYPTDMVPPGNHNDIQPIDSKVMHFTKMTSHTLFHRFTSPALSSGPKNNTGASLLVSRSVEAWPSCGYSANTEEFLLHSDTYKESGRPYQYSIRVSCRRHHR